MQIPSEVWPVIAAVASGVLAWLATRTKTRGDQQIADRPDWSGYTEEIKDWTKVQLQERDGKIERLQKDVGELRAEVSALRRKYNAALTFIRDLIRGKPDHRDGLPGEIVDDL